MATVAIVLNTKKKLLNDLYSASLRVTHNQVRRYYALNSLSIDQSFPFRCRPEEWIQSEDKTSGQFSKSINGFKAMNQVIVDKLALARRILSDYDINDIEFEFEQFERDIKGNRNKANKGNKLRLCDYYDSIIAENEVQQKIGSAIIYDFTKRSINEFQPDAFLADVSVRFLENFESWLRNEKKLKDTTISVKIRNLQRVVNLAIADKLFRQENYPFGEKRYSVNKRLNHATRKRSISTDVISKVRNFQTEIGSNLHFAQNVFMFSYYTRGMNFIDIAELRWANIKDGEINYRRKKTGQNFNITINQFSNEILNYYKRTNKNRGDYIFPIYNDEIYVTAKQKYERKKSALKLVNNKLREIAKELGEVNINLTTYVSRHSYATNLKRSGVSTAIISEALGHTTEQQTQIYLDSFEKGTIEGWENKMFEM